MANWRELANELHADAVAKGFWDAEDAILRHYAKMLSELGEIVNADREGVLYAEGEDGKPEGVIAEMADFVMMALDLIEREYDHEGLIISCPDKAGAEKICEEEVHAYTLAIMGMDAVSEDLNEGAPNALMTMIGVMEIWARVQGYDLEAVIRKKMAYNRTRPKLHGRRY